MRKILPLIFITVILTSCSSFSSNDKNIDLHEFEADSVPYIIQTELDKRGVRFGMSEEEVTDIEKDINFLIDPDATVVTSEFIRKSIYSESPVSFYDNQAILTYSFMDDKLYDVSFAINLEYDKSELSSQPAYSLFLKHTLNYTNILGKPQISDIDNDFSFFTSYSNMWYDGADADKSHYAINVYCCQSKYKLYTDNYSDRVLINYMTDKI